MKVNYKNNTNTCSLDSLGCGSLFRPINSQELFIKTEEDASGDLFNECESRLMDYYINLQCINYERPWELMLCVNVTNGEVVLFHRDMEIVILNATIEIEE